MRAAKLEELRIPPPDMTGLVPITLEVEYRGAATIAHALRDYEDREWVPVSDTSLNIRVFGTRRIMVMYPDLDRESWGVRQHDSAVEELRRKGLRGLNIPELLELGRHVAHINKSLYGLGQVVQGQFNEQMLYVIRRSAGLMPIDRCDGIIPATAAPDPLLAP